MNYLHDVWCNWVDGTTRGYSIPHYHEWKDEDSVQLIDQIPLLLITPELFDFLEDGYDDIPQEILDHIHNRAFIQGKNGSKKRIAYAMVTTDGHRVLTINTEGDKLPSLKSRMIPRQERLVLEMMEDLVPFSLKWEMPETEEEDDTLGGQMLYMKAEYMGGLTRTEREMKEILMDCLYNVYCSKNRAEVIYWYIELFPVMYGEKALQVAELEDLVSHMFDFLKEGWSQRHEEFGYTLVKYYDVFLEDWKGLVKGREKTLING